MERSDEETLRKVVKGDLTEFDILCRRHATKLSNFAYRLLWNWKDAEETTQEALFRVLKSALNEKLDIERGEFPAIMYRTVLHLRADTLRDRNRTARPDELPNRSDDEREPSQTVSSAAENHSQDELDDSLARLNKNDRATLLLRDYIGVNYADIARVLDCPPSQVKTMVHRGRTEIAAVARQDRAPVLTGVPSCDMEKDDLSAYLDGELSGIDIARVEAHLKKCEDCGRELDGLRAGIKRVRAVTEHVPSVELEETLRRRSRDYLDGFLATERRSRIARAARLWAYKAVAACALSGLIVGSIYVAVRFSSGSKTGTEQEPPTTTPLRNVPPKTPEMPPVKLPTGSNVALRAPIGMISKSTLPLRLIEVVGDPPVEQALIEKLDTGEQKTFSTGDEVLPGIHLDSIGQTAVTLNNNGVRERLPLTAAKPEGPNYGGWWRVSYGSPPVDIGFVKITHEGNRIAVRADSYVSGLGRLDGAKMIMSRADAGKQDAITLEAEFDATGQDFTGRAITRYDSGQRESSVLISGQRTPPEQSAILDTQTKGAETVSQRENRLKRIYDALKRYAQERGGRLPYKLSDLVPDYLDDGALVVGEPGVRDITYAGGLSLPSAQDSTISRSAHPDMSPEEALALYADSSDERLEQFFTELVSESWRIAPSGRAILYLDGTTAWEAEPKAEPPLPQELVEPREKERMTVCQNNMKQIGSVLRSWLQEWEGRYPLNVGMLYSRLGNPNVLTCPDAKPHTVSYEFVTLGKTRPPEDEFDSAEAAAEYYSTTPVAIESGEPHLGGHNVLYMDGHTEWHPASERY